MKSKSYKLVIFDWDGTLMNSIDRIATSVQEAARLANMPIPSDLAAKSIIGLSLPKAFLQLYPDLTPEQETILVRSYKQHYMIDSSVQAKLFDQSLTLLEKLQSTDKLITIATGKAREGLDKVLSDTQTTHFFHSTKCADEYTSKPHPHMILSLLEEFNIAPEDAVMIGDSIHDMGMAQQAGVDRIGITHGAHGHDELVKYQPVSIVNTIAELQELLLPVS